MLRENVIRVHGSGFKCNIRIRIGQFISVTIRLSEFIL